MPAGATDVTVCNVALKAIGKTIISSLENPTSENQELCAQFYPRAVDQVLAAHPWGCAKAMLTLAPLADTPPAGFAKQYLLPSDVVAPRELVGSDSDWEVQGDKLLTDDLAITLAYTKRIAPDLMSAWVMDAVIAALTEMLVAPGKGELKLMFAKGAAYQATLDKAKGDEALYGRKRSAGAPLWVDAR
jgi:hypothetical protein